MDHVMVKTQPQQSENCKLRLNQLFNGLRYYSLVVDYMCILLFISPNMVPILTIAAASSQHVVIVIYWPCFATNKRQSTHRINNERIMRATTNQLNHSSQFVLFFDPFFHQQLTSHHSDNDYHRVEALTVIVQVMEGAMNGSILRVIRLGPQGDCKAESNCLEGGGVVYNIARGRESKPSLGGWR